MRGVTVGGTGRRGVGVAAGLTVAPGGGAPPPLVHSAVLLPALPSGGWLAPGRSVICAVMRGACAATPVSSVMAEPGGRSTPKLWVLITPEALDTTTWALRCSAAVPALRITSESDEPGRQVAFWKATAMSTPPP